MSLTEQLENLLKQNSLPHGILLSGHDNEGLLGEAKELAKKILEAENLESHPDYIYIGSEKVEDVRNLLSVLALKSFGKRVVVLDKAENLTPQAGNLLLKRIEEPAAETMFIVLTTAESRLLPTLRSRLMAFQVGLSELAASSNLSVDFLKAEKLEDRLRVVKSIDPHQEDLNLFLKKIYENEIKNFSARTGSRLSVILKTFEFLSANVQANRAFAWLAIKW